MKTLRCPYEDELLDALGRGYVNDALAQHVRECHSCTELRLTAGALLDDKSTAVIEAAVPSSSAMWWRIQLQQRQDAEAAARRSLLIGQGATLTAALGFAFAIFGTDLAASARHIVASIQLSTPVLIAAAMSLLLAPIAGWVAIRQK